MIKMMTKDEWYATVANAKDNGYTAEDCLNIVLDGVVEGTATIRELFKYAHWLNLTADKKEIKRIVKEERAKRRQSNKMDDTTRKLTSDTKNCDDEPPTTEEQIKELLDL